MDTTSASKSETDPRLKERLPLLSDDILFEMAEKKSGEFTPEALAMINAEVVKRGGVDALKERIEKAEKPQPSREDIKRLRRFFFVTVIAACGLFIFAVNGSSWFYWLCLFALIGSLFAVLFLPRHNPEDEIKELLSKAPSDSGNATGAAGSEDSETS